MTTNTGLDASDMKATKKKLKAGRTMLIEKNMKKKKTLKLKKSKSKSKEAMKKSKTKL